MRVLTWRGKLYYGWLLVIGLGLTETTSYGVLTYAFTVFVRPMQEELGWSRAAISGGYALALLVSGLAAIPVGRWLDLHGPRLLMTAGSCAAAALVLAWSAVQDLLTYYVIWAALGLTLAAVLYEPAFAVVATWFIRHRGRALTVLTFIAGFASVIYVPLAGWLVETQGWRAALATLAAILALGTIPLHALLLRRRPEDLGLAPDGEPLPAAGGTVDPPGEREVTTRQALQSSTFWWITAAFFLNTLGAAVLFVHLVPYLIDRGFEPGLASATTGLIGALALPGRLVFTPLGDRLPRQQVTALLFALQALALLVLLLAPGALGVYGFVLLFGAGFGAITPARAALVADLFGRGHYARIAGVLAALTTLARAAGPLGAGAIYDAFHSYVPALWALLLCSLVAAAAVLAARAGPEQL